MSKKYPKTEKIIRELPQQFLAGFKLGTKTGLPKNLKRNKISRVIFCGMGGSALPGLIVNTWLQTLARSLPVDVWRNYDLPATGKGDLVIISSYSGNTEEALSSFYQALKRKDLVIALTSDGRLLRLALTKKIPAVIVPSGIMPRFAVGYLTGAFLGVLVKLKVILNPEKNLRGASKKIKGSAIEKDAKGVAKFFENKVPLIYTADEWRTLGHIWKISFNETAKLPSFHYILPELNHNELQGFTAKPLRQNKIFAALFLKEKSINPRLYKRFFLTEKFFASKGNIKSRGLILKGNNFWEKLISGTMLAYWTSYFLALKRGVVPEDESAIEEFKKLMR